jgi:hypothetical protein
LPAILDIIGDTDKAKHIQTVCTEIRPLCLSKVANVSLAKSLVANCSFGSMDGYQDTTSGCVDVLQCV